MSDIAQSIERYLSGQEPVAWLSIDSIGERYLCFSKPRDTDEAQPLFAMGAVFGGLHTSHAEQVEALVERCDDLEWKLKTAIEGQRCECSADDMCRFAKERDELRSKP